MSRIHLTTIINAPVAQCFNLARNIDFHVKSSTKTHERAIGGKTSGLIGAGDEVTFSAVHFGLRQTLTSRIVEYKFPEYFTDEMVKGAFKSLRHHHLFKAQGSITIMEDDLNYEVPFGFPGKLFDKLFLRKHMQSFLKERNNKLKNELEKGLT